METSGIKALYTLKQSANEHLKNKQFSQASVYFSDILNKFTSSIQQIESEEQMEKVIKEIKLPAHKNLSLCYLKLSEFTSCTQQCEEALQIEPNCLKILYRIGKALMALKQYDSAQRYLKRGFAIDPHQEQILKALQQIQAARNSKHINNQSLISLKKILALILYWPLLIFNMILTKLFGKVTNSIQTQKTLDKKQ